MYVYIYFFLINKTIAPLYIESFAHSLPSKKEIIWMGNFAIMVRYVT